MTRTLVYTLLLLTATVGCEEAADLQQDANTAQRKADAQIAEVRSDASKDIRAAQATADRTIAGAQADFGALREEYRHQTATRLADLDQKVVILEGRAAAAAGQEKAARETRLQLIRAHRTVYLEDYKALDTATGATWDDTRTRLDREWNDLAELVEKS